MLTNNRRRGFAIPTAVLVIMVLTIMVAGGFSIVSAERRSVADQKSQISAFRIAEQGLEIYLVARDSLITAGLLKCNPSPCQHVPAAKDSANIAVTGGTAQVSLTMIRPPINNQSGLYVVRSKGIETTNAYNGSPQAVRTVAQYVLWEPIPNLLPMILGDVLGLELFQVPSFFAEMSSIMTSQLSAVLFVIVLALSARAVKAAR